MYNGCLQHRTGGNSALPERSGFLQVYNHICKGKSSVCEKSPYCDQKMVVGLQKWDAPTEQNRKTIRIG
jgi:hypothetical protein